EGLWLLHGRQPATVRVAIGGAVLVGALLLLHRRRWRAGAAIVGLGLAAACGWHLAAGGARWPLALSALVLGGLVARDARAPVRAARLRRRFADGTLPPSALDHRAHLTVALDYVRRLGPDAALATLRPGLQALAARAGRPEKYHETRTQAWVALV